MCKSLLSGRTANVKNMVCFRYDGSVGSAACSASDGDIIRKRVIPGISVVSATGLHFFAGDEL